MKKVLVAVLTALVLVAALSGAAFAATGITDPAVLMDLAKVRRATQKYHDVNVALADGFVPTPHCTADPEKGGMGIHYVNIERIMDPATNMLEPEVLLYVEQGGKLKLTGVEYMTAIGAPDAPIPDPAPAAPELFGRAFDGPMLGHEPGMPPHYDFHVWLFQANPEGMFTPYNPSIKCPETVGH